MSEATQLTRLTREDLEDYDTLDLEDMFDELSLSKIDIEGQIESAKAQRIETGEYSDPVWFRRASTALKYINRTVQMLQQEIAARKKDERRERNDAIERRFIKLAKERLDPGLYWEIMNDANQEDDR